MKIIGHSGKASEISFAGKVGYGFGDMASSMFWKIFSYYLPFFYSNIFGLRLDQVALLLIVTRIWDAVSDPMMGLIADRTSSRWGKYRPYILLMAAPFAICGILLFVTPDFSPTWKLVWAYVTYILMMTVYTGINVPYGAMLGVMTYDSDTKTVLSSFRMFFAYIGSFLAMLLWEPLCERLGGAACPEGWTHAMIVIASLCFIIFLACFLLTKERAQTASSGTIGGDIKALLSNFSWWTVLSAALCANLFNTLRGSAVPYFFNDVIGSGVRLDFLGLNFLFYAGLFLSLGEIGNMIGVSLTPLAGRKIGKKSTFITSFAILMVFSAVFYFIPSTPAGCLWMIVFQIIISIFTGINSALVWSMYADVADYSEFKHGSSSTGLIFSSSSMAQKFGGAFGGAALMWILSAFGYDTASSAVQSPQAIEGIKMLMSWIPAGVAGIAILCMSFYPLTKERMKSIRVMKSIFIAVLILVPTAGLKAQNPVMDAIRKVSEEEHYACGIIGVKAMTLEGEVLADWNSQVCLLPASNVKLITTALALNTLGPDFRYETSLGYHGRIDEGKLSGDLYILGSGDPTLGMREYDAHSDIFRQWKGILALHGINEIDGRIIADHRPMGIIPVNPGWLLEDVVCGDGLDSRGLNYSRNVVNSAHLFDYGFVAVPTPSNDCAAAFGKYLQEMGYIVTGEYADDSAEGVLSRDEIAVLGSTCSYKLSQIVSFTNAKSDNFCAEALMNKVLEVTTLSEAMNDLGITDMRGCRIVDGCGLSRKNYVSPAFFCDFLSAMARKNCFRDYLASLPQPGKGTLASKLHNEPESVKRRVYMKSGTMTGVRCFSGYVLPRNGDLSRLIMFSIMTNNVSAPSAIESSCIDRIIAAIAARN